MRAKALVMKLITSKASCRKNWERSDTSKCGSAHYYCSFTAMASQFCRQSKPKCRPLATHLPFVIHFAGQEGKGREGKGREGKGREGKEPSIISGCPGMSLYVGDMLATAWRNPAEICFWYMHQNSTQPDLLRVHMWDW